MAYIAPSKRRSTVTLAVFVHMLLAVFDTGQCRVLPHREESIIVGSYSQPEGCALEYSNDASDISHDKTYYKVGERQKFRCDDNGSPWLNDFILFPGSERICLSNGIWSSPPPRCIDEYSHYAENGRMISEVVITDLPHHDIDSSIWVEVGQVQDGSRCAAKADSNKSLDSRRKVYEVTKHVEFKSLKYLSFAMLESNSTLIEVRAMKIFAPYGTVIEIMSEEARGFLESHCSNYTTIQPREHSMHQSYVVEGLSVYTTELLVVVTYVEEIPDADHLKNTPPILSIADLDLMLSLSFYDIRGIRDDTGGCPLLGTIPNAHHYHEDPDEKGEQKFRFVCDKGYVMFDPVSNTLSDGVIRCLNNETWNPSQRPVCRRIIRQESAVLGKNVVALKTEPPATDDAADTREASAISTRSAVITTTEANMPYNSTLEDTQLGGATPSWNYWIPIVSLIAVVAFTVGYFLRFFSGRGKFRLPCFQKPKPAVADPELKDASGSSNSLIAKT